MRQPSTIDIRTLQELLDTEDSGGGTPRAGAPQNRDPKEDSDEEDQGRTRAGGGRHAEEDRGATTRTVYRHRT